MVDNRYNPYKGLSDRCVESLMPKGVEHWDWDVDSSGFR